MAGVKSQLRKLGIDSFPEVTAAIAVHASVPSVQSVFEAIQVLERFIVLLYDRICPVAGVNEARKRLFTQKGSPLNVSLQLLLHCPSIQNVLPG